MIKYTDCIDWNKKIIFAPNATGKTTVAKEIYSNQKLSKEAVELMTAKNIENLVSITDEKLYVGISSANEKENADIEKYLESIKIIKEKIFKDYNIQSATQLRGVSYTYELLNIKNDKIIDLIKIIKDKNISNEKSTDSIDYETALNIDKLFSKKEFDNIELDSLEKITDNIFNESNKTLSKEKAEKLREIYNTIQYYETNCPLCGYEYKSNDELLEKINNYLSTFSIQEEKIIAEKINLLYQKVGTKLDKSVLEVCNIKYDNNISLKEKIQELLKIINLLNKVEAVIINNIWEVLKVDQLDKKVDVYFSNIKKINIEKSKIINMTKYYETIIEEFNKLVILPENLKLLKENNIIVIQDIKTSKKLTPQECLSESELKRLCLAVLASLIQHADLKYIILDDPLDSYDDYFLKVASEYIITLLSNNTKVRWTIFTHLIDLILHINKNVQEVDGIKYIFYLYEPNYRYEEGRKPNLLQLKNVKPSHIEEINTHEILMFSKLFSEDKRSSVKEKMLILIASISTTRNIVLDISEQINISFKRNKVKTTTKYLEDTVIHYSNKNKFKFKKLLKLTNKVYKKANYNNKHYIKYIETDTTLIRSNLINDYAFTMENEVIEIILYTIIRMSSCKWQLEKKLINKLIENGIEEKEITEICKKKKTISKKIEYAQKIIKREKIECDISEYYDIYQEFKKLINDFSHGTVRMFPPYLSVSSYDIAKYEYLIENIT